MIRGQKTEDSSVTGGFAAARITVFFLGHLSSEPATRNAGAIRKAAWIAAALSPSP
jgi:hypothetical protein